MWITALRNVITLSSREAGMGVQALVDLAGISKYRARIIIREFTDAGIIKRLGNRYYYNFDNPLEATIASAKQSQRWQQQVKGYSR